MSSKNDWLAESIAKADAKKAKATAKSRAKTSSESEPPASGTAQPRPSTQSCKSPSPLRRQDRRSFFSFQLDKKKVRAKRRSERNSRRRADWPQSADAPRNPAHAGDMIDKPFDDDELALRDQVGRLSRRGVPRRQIGSTGLAQPERPDRGLSRAARDSQQINAGTQSSTARLLLSTMKAARPSA